jgi:hypothetical protein
MAFPITIQELREQIVPAPMKLTAFAEKNKSKMEQFYLSDNSSPAAFHYIRQNFQLYTEDHQFGAELLHSGLTCNPAAIAYIENNINTDGEDYLRNTIFSNPSLTANVLAMMLPIYNITADNFYRLMSANPSSAAVDYMMDQHPDKICWPEWCTNSNPRAVAFLKKNRTKINYSYLSRNTSNEAMRLLEAVHPAHIDFDQLAMNSNPRAFKLLLEHAPYINYNNLAANKNPEALAYLFKHAHTEYPYEINWRVLTRNPSAMNYLEANPSKVVFPIFWQNPAIFEKDYHAVAKERMPLLKEELQHAAFHPDRIDLWVKMGVKKREIIDNLIPATF